MVDHEAHVLDNPEVNGVRSQTELVAIRREGVLESISGDIVCLGAAAEDTGDAGEESEEVEGRLCSRATVWRFQVPCTLQASAVWYSSIFMIEKGRSWAGLAHWKKKSYD